MNIPLALNLDFVEDQYGKWRQSPESVSRDWQLFFEGFELARTGEGPGQAVDPAAGARQSRVQALVYAYRDLGHLLACMDPLESCPLEHPLLAIETFGLDPGDLEQQVTIQGMDLDQPLPLQELIRILKDTYCRSVGVEYMHLQDPEERGWLQARMEPVRNRPEPDTDQKKRILQKLIHAASFEQFLNRKYIAVTRFSLEGADSIIPMLDVLVSGAARAGVKEIILGMAHRGRLNIQANILQKPYADIISEFETCYDPDQLTGAGDVKYHNGYLAELTTPEGDPIRICLVNNPSHLEAVDGVVAGLARARQDALDAGGASQVLPLVIHGDAAFAGQGVVAETLNMAQLEGYGTGGSVHVIINNQIGYTTLPADARSTRYATDVAKGFMSPVFHVHGENPEALAHVIQLALDYRQRFAKDVVVDVVCFRRYGHNEGDEPYFTQPLMYERIRSRAPIHERYGDDLKAQGVATADEIQAWSAAVFDALETEYAAIHGQTCTFPQIPFYDIWDHYPDKNDLETVKTQVPAKVLKDLARQLNSVPPDFNCHSKLTKLLERRNEAVQTGQGIDWGNAEALALGALLLDKVPIRLSGQDSRRGTFSQRHLALWDVKTGEDYIPMNHLKDAGAKIRAFNSPLAEYSVLAFEYGYSLVRPDCLVLWEAQFGDFINNAQAIVDLFIASGQTKWERKSGLVLLLPHGMEGMGPEHSSARPERFLQLCADNNLIVCNPTTPAQYFHLLRRQALAKFKRPLIILTPKSLLRLPAAVSTLEDFAKSGFQTVMTRPIGKKGIQRVLFCSGKIFYELVKKAEEANKTDLVIVRLEQLYPFAQAALKAICDKYKKAKTWCWVQEEAENMGAWWFVRSRLEELVGKPLTYIGRRASATPATGFPHVYRRDQADVIERALEI